MILVSPLNLTESCHCQHTAKTHRIFVHACINYTTGPLITAQIQREWLHSNVRYAQNIETKWGQRSKVTSNKVRSRLQRWLMRSADRGISTVDGDGPMDVWRGGVVAVLQQILDVLYNEINCHYRPHHTHCLISLRSSHRYIAPAAVIESYLRRWKPSLQTPRWRLQWCNSNATVS